MAIDTSGVFSVYGQKTKRAYYEGMYGSLKTERASFDPHWQDLGKFLLPRRVRFTSSDRNKGDKRNQSILDSTGTFAARTLESGLHAGLTSPARPWFNLGTPDADLNEFGPVKKWLYDVTSRMRTIFSQTNLYNALPIVYGDIGTFGTAAMGIVPDSRDLFRATAYPIGSYVLGTSARGVVNTFMREYEMSVFHVVEAFGGEDGGPAVPGKPINWENISLTVKNAWERGDYDVAVQILWVVAPNKNHRPDSPLMRHALYTSCHFERGNSSNRAVSDNENGKILRESGFRTFPILAPRWSITGEDAYGTSCPGMVALPDVRQLQEMQRKKAQAIAKMVDPPLQAPSSLRTQKTSLVAGDITYADVREGMQGVRPIHDMSINIEHLILSEQATQFRIKTAYYEPLFLMLAQSDGLRSAQPVTAREIEERHEEKLLALGPVLERTNDELLDPLIDRCYSMMEDAGMLPPIPEELDQVPLKVEYVSIMAAAQKLVGVVSQDRFLQTMVPLGQVFPEVNAKLNVKRIVDNYSIMLGIDPNAVRTDDEAQAILDKQQQQQDQLAQAQIARDAAQAGKLASETPLSTGGTALDAVQQAVTGQ